VTDDRTSPVPAEPRPGASLAAARRERGLTVEDVAAATRIRVQLVNEIEQDQYANCGGAIYARGHIRAIAHVVGADADELVALFDRQHGGAPVPTIAPAALPVLTVPAADRQMANAGSSSPRWASAAIAVLAVAAVFLGVTWFLGRGSNSPQQTAEPPVRTGAVLPGDSPSPTPTPSATTPSPTPTVPPGVSVRVQITGAQSWIRVQSSTDEELFSGVLDAGQTREWHDPQLLTVRFGNANVVRLVVNGRDVGQPCDRQVCTVRFPASVDTAG
jgi:cytoskeleton protein RodZ